MHCPDCDHDNISGDDQCANCGLDLAGLDVRAWGVNPRDPVLTRSLAELPLKEPLLLGPEATVAEAIDLLAERHEGCVFVVEGTKLVGVFTERDVVLRVAAGGRDPGSVAIGEVMTPRPFALRRDDELAFALHRMGFDGYRHIPVLEHDVVVGFLSMRTVLHALVDA